MSTPALWLRLEEALLEKFIVVMEICFCRTQSQTAFLYLAFHLVGDHIASFSRKNVGSIVFITGFPMFAPIKKHETTWNNRTNIISN